VPESVHRDGSAVDDVKMNDFGLGSAGSRSVLTASLSPEQYPDTHGGLIAHNILTLS